MPPYGGPSRSDEVIAALATCQGGRVARWQLLELEVSSRMIERRLDAKRLIREWPGVYRVGHAAETRNGRWWGALLLGGPDAGLTHRSGAEARGLLRATSSLIHVTTPRDVEDRAHLRFHRGRRDFERVDGMPVAGVAQILIDLAATATRRTLERALDEAERKRVLDVEAFDALTTSRAKGTRALRAALEKHRPGTTITESSHEEAFLAFLDAGKLPRPELNVPMTLPDGSEIRVDALWRRHRLVVEVDGPHIHGRPGAIRADHRRDLQLKLARYEVIRVTTEMLGPALAAHLRRLTAR